MSHQRPGVPAGVDESEDWYAPQLQPLCRAILAAWDDESLVNHANEDWVGLLVPRLVKGLQDSGS